jgi:hypothetical protein
VERTVPAWEKLLANKPASSTETIVRFHLAAALERLDRQQEAAAIHRQLQSGNTTLPIFFNGPKDPDAGLAEFRAQLEQFLIMF